MASIVSVAALGHRLNSLPSYTVDGAERPYSLHALLILVGRGLSADTLDNHVNQFVMHFLLDEPDVILLRVHPTKADRVVHVLESQIGLRDRFEGRAVGVITLSSSGDWIVKWAGGLEPESMSPPIPMDDDEVVHLCREGELRSYAERPGALLPASDALHYEGPNESHYGTFFRGSFAFSSRDAIDGLAFWLAPMVPPRSAILLESPGFLGVGLGVADYFRRELGCQPEEVPFVEARDFYGEEPGLIATRLQDDDAGLDRPVVILSSVVSSGRSLDAMTEACANAGFNDVRSVVLFGAQGSSGLDKPLQMLPFDLTREEQDACGACLVDRKPVVRIRKSTGLVEVSALVEEARITVAPARQAAEFFERYAHNSAVVSVHADQHDSRRHHVIDISVAALCEEPGFVERVAGQIGKLKGRSIAVLHPAHDDARALAALVAAKLGANSVVECDPDYLVHLGVSERAVLTSAETVLIVDDVSITGTRLRRYRTFLNACHIVDAAGSPEIIAFVGVLRPESAYQRQCIADMSDRPIGLLCAEELILPDWREGDCPWCAEEKLLDGFRLPYGSLLHDRRIALGNGGLTSELFLPFSATSSPGTDSELMGPIGLEADPVDAMDLGPRSVFGNLINEAQVFVAVASTLQAMRDPLNSVDGSRLSATFTSPLSRVLSPEYYVTGRFYAPVILCSVLRASRRFDLRATAIESRLRRAIGERYGDLQDLRAEMLYHMARGIFPRPSEAADQNLVAGMDPSVAQFIAHLSLTPG